MRFFPLLGFQHVLLFFFPALIFIILLLLAIGRFYVSTQDSEERIRRIAHTFPEGIEARNAPFPLVLLLIIIVFLIWAIGYTLGTGLLGVRI
jgi:Na+/H+ antiporter NhaC